MQIYFGVTIDKEASIERAGRSRGTPRIANRLLKRVADYATVLNNSNISEEIAKLALGKLEIDEIGLDNIDRKILNTIIDIYKGRTCWNRSFGYNSSEKKEIQ